MALNDRERVVVACQIMRLTEKEALAYLKANGQEMSAETYYRIKARIKREHLKQAYDIAREFPYLHMERVNEIELIRSEFWINYHRESAPYRKACILKMILELQPFASAYAEATKDIMEGEINAIDNRVEEGYTNVTEQDNTS